MKTIKVFIEKIASFIQKIFSKKKISNDTSSQSDVSTKTGYMSELMTENPILQDREIVEVHYSDSKCCPNCKKFVKRYASKCGSCGANLPQNTTAYKIGDGVSHFNELPLIYDIINNN